jgi:tRNA (guanosine-2'-O-)-methyltransferase
LYPLAASLKAQGRHPDMLPMEENKKSKPSLRAKADKIKGFRCKNLIAVIEYPNDLRNIGTIIRNVNALGVEKAYVVTDHEFLPDDWQEMRGRRALNAISASAIKWSFVRKFPDTESCLGHLERKGFVSVVTSPHTRAARTSSFMKQTTPNTRSWLFGLVARVSE